jgi:hypothetical protein
MKALAIIIAVVAAIYGISSLVFPTYTHRYRLTVEIDTPDGSRSGSSVIEVVRSDNRWVLIAQGRYAFSVRGEAVFVDLGAGRNVIALLAHGDRAEYVDQMISLPIEAYGHFKWSEEAWAGRARMQGPVELKPPLIPTLVSFSDLADPKTARLVRLGEFETVFGPGVRFRRAWIEMTKSSATIGIEKRLLWWTLPGRPAYQAHLAMKNGDTTGPASAGEYLFVRR